MKKECWLRKKFLEEFYGNEIKEKNFDLFNYKEKEEENENKKYITSEWFQ